MELTSAQRSELAADLVRLVQELRASLQESAESARPVALDPPAVGRVSRIDALQQQKMVEANRRAARTRLDLARHAQRRIETGEYGDCARCGEPVAYRRLKARPETPLCIACQEASERV